MSKISAQIWAFVVLMLALALGVWFVDNQDINTGVNTKEESILPNIFPAEGEENPTGLTFRYPRGWLVQAENTNFILSADTGENVYDFNLSLAQPTEAVDLEQELLTLIGEQQVALQQQGVAPTFDPEDFEENADEVEHGQEALRYELEDETQDTVQLFEVGRLTDEGIIYRLTGQNPVLKEEWDEVDEELDNILRSFNTENLVMPQAAFTYTLPEGWQIADETFTGFAATGAIDPTTGQEGTFVQVAAMPETEMRDFLVVNLASQIAPEATQTEVPTSRDALQIIADAESMETGDLTEVEYFGYSGQEVTINVPNGQILRVAVLELDEDTRALVVASFASPEVLESAQPEVEELLNSVQYNPQDAE